MTEDQCVTAVSDDEPATPTTGRRAQVLALLRTSGEPCSIAALSRVMGVHPNTVRFHLDALSADGLVELADNAPRGPGRPPSRYRARRTMDPTGPRNFQLLATILAEQFASEPAGTERAIEAGRSWGSRMLKPEPAEPDTPIRHDSALARLLDLLDELGFRPDPVVTESDTRVTLRHCPFLELANTRPEVVCPLHLGLMQGALASLGADSTVEKLEPFVEPDMCLAHVSRAQNSRS